jgi:photosystem II stability/assembly factor-like uncharacterized protein
MRAWVRERQAASLSGNPNTATRADKKRAPEAGDHGALAAREELGRN